MTGPLLDPVDRYSELIVRRTVKAEHVHEVHARKRHEAREEREERERFENLPGGVTMATLESIAACESVGGSGDPAAAPEAEQDYRAALLYSEAGSSPWPICG